MARNAQAVERMVVVKTHKQMFVHEDGTIDNDGKPTKLYLDSTGDVTFVYLLPKYVSDALSLKDRVSAKTAEEALEKYETTIQAYVQWKRTALAELVILARISYEATTEAGDRSIISEDRLSYAQERRIFGNRPNDYNLTSKHSIGLSYILAFRVNKDFYERVPVMEVYPEGHDHAGKDTMVPVNPPQWKPGGKLTYSDEVRHAKAFPYSDELVAKLDQVASAIDQAARVLHGVVNAEDVTAALLGLGSTTLRLTA